MSLDLDRYYTPEETANEVVEAIGAPRGSACADTSCGEGNLLGAASRVARSSLHIGVDTDANAVRALRRRHPEYVLSRGDFLSSRSRSRMGVRAYLQDIEVLYLNPPFSMESKKGVKLADELGGGRCSVAMAHVATALGLIRPAFGASAIVPESLVYSNLDGPVRETISRDYSMEVVRGLKNSTFSGARANACILRFTPADKKAKRRRSLDRCGWPNVDVIRGGLPVFEARTWRRGRRFVHSTDLEAVVGRKYASLRRVKPINRGHVGGHCILIPRVGVPRRDLLEPVYLRPGVQLSDCVIGLVCSSCDEASELATRIKRCWRSFVGLYRGTGARYVTVQRLADWLEGF